MKWLKFLITLIISLITLPYVILNTISPNYIYYLIWVPILGTIAYNKFIRLIIIISVIIIYIFLLRYCCKLCKLIIKETIEKYKKIKSK